jgi:N6-adenosine-specific RNA methylase IME4
MPNALVKAPSVPAAMRALDAMQRELSTATTYDQMMSVVDRAGALKLLLKDVDGVKVKAEDTIISAHQRIGAELARVPKATKHQSSQAGKSTTGIPPTNRHRFAKLAAAPTEDIERVKTELRAKGKDATPRAVVTELTHGDKAQRRKTREQALATKIRALPDQRFGIIYADPATKFEVRSGRGMDRSADNHYPTQTLDEIRAMPVGGIASPDAMLALWTTVPMLAHSLSFIEHWGFEYKSMLTWDKVAHATGYWFLNQTEHLLIATRGRFVAPGEGQRIRSLFAEKKTRHSAKPDGIADWIERTWPDTPKIELFRRGAARPGWSAWGNETQGDTDEPG